MIQVFLHQLDQREIAKALAKEADPKASRRGVRTLVAEITRGQRAYAFLSYASPDRAEVIMRAQGLKAGGTDFFHDLLSLGPGEQASPGVMKETEYALARRAASGGRVPDIIPVLIEGPPPPTPPEALKDIHFNDCLLYVLSGIEAHATAVSGHH